MCNANCNNMGQCEDYLSQVIFYDNIFIDLYTIEQLIYFRLKSDNNICPLWEYISGKIINPKDKKYIISAPLFIFIGFDLTDINDNYNINANKISSDEEINNIIFN